MTALERELLQRQRDLMLSIVLAGDVAHRYQLLRREAKRRGLAAPAPNELREQLEADCNARFVELIRSGKRVLETVDTLIAEQRLERWQAYFKKEQ